MNAGMMKLVFVMLGKRDFRSGGYAFNFRMVRYLESMGHEVEVIHFTTVPDGLPRRTLRACFHVAAVVRRTQPDLVIIAKSYQFVPLLRLMNIFWRYPVLYLMHHLEWNDLGPGIRRRMYGNWVRWLLGMAGHLWANSENTAEGIVELGFSRDSMTVIPPGFEKTAEPPPDRSGREFPLRLLCAGSLSPVKDQLTLIRAIEGLEGNMVTLQLAGSTESDPVFTEAVRAEIRNKEMDDIVTISGNLEREEMERAYKSADILVHPARWEAYGMAVAEGMWQGLPVVACRSGAIPEIVRDGENGLLVPEGDHRAMREALLRLAGNDELRLRMGRKSRMFARDLFDWHDTEEAFLQLVLKASGV